MAATGNAPPAPPTPAPGCGVPCGGNIGGFELANAAAAAAATTAAKIGVVESSSD